MRVYDRPIGAVVRSMGVRTFFFLLILSNLMYSLIPLEWIEEGVVAFAMVALFFLAALIQRSLLVSNLGEVIVMVLFAALVIAQQYYLANGNVSFGIKWAATLLGTFVPYWIARSLGRVGAFGLEHTVGNALATLFIVTTITVIISYLFGQGEVYVQPSGITRAFGWLGDSFSPVFVFFVFYYLFRRQYALAALSLVVLFMTVAKSALLMLFLSPIIIVFSAASPRIKIAISAVYFILLVVLVTLSAPILERISDLFQADYSYHTRLLSVYSGMSYFASAPFTGIGINQSLLSIENDARGHAARLGIDTYFNVLHIDNSIVRVAAEAGLPGLALLLALLYFMLRAAFKLFRAGQVISNSRERAIVLASSLWVISFILFYQTTGWFEAGHPQLAWLLLFATLTDVFYRRAKTRMILTGRVIAQAESK